MTNPAAILGIGSSIAGGVVGAQAAGVKAQGEQLNIQGQMLQTVGRAFQFDTESQEYTFKSQEETYQADVSRINRDVAKQNMYYELSKGEVEAEQSGMQSRFELASAKASQGASGIDVNSASSTRTRESMIEIGSYNQALIRANAAHIAYGYDIEMTNMEAQAAVHDMQSSLDRAQADNAKTAAGITREGIPLEQQAYGLAGQAGQLGAAASYISAAGSVASKWMQGSFMGMMPGGAGGAGAPVGGD